MLSFKKLSQIIERGHYLTEDVELNNKKLEALMRVFEYTESFEWLSSKNTREKIKTLILTNYDYAKTAEIFLTSKNSIEVTASQASKKLLKAIGYNTLDLILAGDVDQAMKQFYIASKILNSKHLLVKGVAEFMPKPKEDPKLDILSCKNEIGFMIYFSLKKLEEKLSQVDIGKIAHLMYILDSGDLNYYREKELLLKLIEQDISGNEFKKKIEEIKTKNLYMMREEERGVNNTKNPINE